MKAVMCPIDFDPTPRGSVLKLVPFCDLIEVQFCSDGLILVDHGAPQGSVPVTADALSRRYKQLPDDLAIRWKAPGSYDDWRVQELGVLKREFGLRPSLVWTVDSLRSALLDESLVYVVVDGIASKPDSEHVQPELLADYNSAGWSSELESGPVMLLSRSRS